MDLEAFKKYVQSRKKLDSEFKIVPNLDTQYNKYLDDKKKINDRTKQWYSEKIQTDDEFKQKRKTYNKKSYDTLKSKKGSKKEDVKIEEPIIKMNINIPEPIINENIPEQKEQRKIISMLDLYDAF